MELIECQTFIFRGASVVHCLTITMNILRNQKLLCNTILCSKRHLNILTATSRNNNLSEAVVECLESLPMNPNQQLLALVSPYYSQESLEQLYTYIRSESQTPFQLIGAVVAGVSGFPGAALSLSCLNDPVIPFHFPLDKLRQFKHKSVGRWHDMSVTSSSDYDFDEFRSISSSSLPLIDFPLELREFLKKQELVYKFFFAL